MDVVRGPVETMALSSLTHNFCTPPGVKERLLIRLLNVKLPEYCGQDLQCSVAVSAASPSSSKPYSPSKAQPAFLKKECVELHNGAMEVIIDTEDDRPDGWRSDVDPMTGRVYYYNTKTRESQWEKPSQEPWCVRLQLFRGRARPFAGKHVADVIEVIPQPASRVALRAPGVLGRACEIGTATLEVLRLIPGSARQHLVEALSTELASAVADARSGETDMDSTGTKPDAVQSNTEVDKASTAKSSSELDRVCTSIQELCTGEAAHPVLARMGLQLLENLIYVGRLTAIEVLMAEGVQPTVETVYAAEKAGSFELAHRLVERLKPRVAGTKAKDAGLQLVWALQQKLPGLADRILEYFPSTLKSLPCQPGSPAAKMAYTAGALRVVAALMQRGDPSPAPVRELLEAALTTGNVGLAQACLAKAKDEDLSAEEFVHICLVQGASESGHPQMRRASTVLVREALEARWRERNAQQKWCSSSSEDLLALATVFTNGPKEDPVECSICFESLHTSGPSVFLTKSGVRSCPHFFCQCCADQLEEDLRYPIDWMDDLIDMGTSVARLECPLCRRQFQKVARLPDPTLDPVHFFRHACTPETFGDRQASAEPQDLRLRSEAAYAALCAVLPVDPAAFKAQFTNTLWPAWTSDKSVLTEGLTEADFTSPGGMLSWLSNHLIELKVEQQRGTPPNLLEDPEAWFRHFDYDCNGLLSKNEVLRGLVKVANMSGMASTSSTHNRCDGAQRLRDSLNDIWNDVRWKHGVPKKDFLGTDGLAKKLVEVLGGEEETNFAAMASLSSRCSSESNCSMSVEEALAKARAADLAAKHETKTERKKKSEPKASPEVVQAQVPQRRPPLQSAAWGGPTPILFDDIIGAMDDQVQLMMNRQPSCEIIEDDVTDECTIQELPRTRAGATPARDSHVLIHSGQEESSI